MKKQILLSAALCALVSAPTWAEKFEVGDFAFNTLTDSTVELTVPDFPYEGDVVIPATATYNGKTYTVTQIGSKCFYANRSVTSVVMPNTITKIAQQGCYYIPQCKSITLSQNLEEIGQEGFASNGWMTGIELPKSLKKIGGYAFESCNGLLSIVVPEGVTYIGNTAFGQCGKLETASLPSTLTYFGNAVFNNCLKLKTIDVAEGCQAVASVGGVLYNGEKTILKQCPCMFQGVVTLPETCVEIANMAFKSCTGVTSVKCSDGLKTLQQGAFWSCGMESVSLGKSLKSISNYAFYDCKNLKAVQLPEVDTLTFASGSGKYFANMPELEEFVLPDGARGLMAADVFSGDTKLAKITLGANVTGFGANSFQNLAALKTIVCRSTTPYVFQNPQGAEVESGFAAADFKNITLIVPKSALEAYKNAPVWEDFDNIVAAPEAIIPPYFNDFSGDDAVAGWTNIDGNNDDDLWKIGYKDGVSYLWAPYNDDIPMDDWMITPAIQFEGGQTYELSFDVRINNPAYAPEKLEVKMGNSNTAEAMTETILAPTEYSNGQWKTESFTLRPATSGLYYIGLHCITDADKTQLHITNFAIGAAGTVEVKDVIAADTEAAYYDLMGRKVQNPQGGIFIKVQGNKASKVAL